MQAVRVQSAPKGSEPFSPSNPAPPSSLKLEKATTVIRDALTWPETYAKELAILGHDFSGVVEDVFTGPNGGNATLKRGDEVFGMAHADRGSTWAEYTIVKDDEVAWKPRNLTWEEAASLPLSALTAFEALFDHGGLPWPARARGQGEEQPKSGKRVLITGSSGGVGIYLVQLAAIANVRVVAASSSNSRNEAFLRNLGADEIVEYSALKEKAESSFDLIIDTVGGETLAACWSWIACDGTLISVDSASFNFVNDHRRCGLCSVKENVRALFFIVRGNGRALANLARLAESGHLKPFVLQEFELAQAREAYERASSKSFGHGKVVIRV